MNKKDAYELKLQAQIDEWQADIDKLKAKAGKMDANIQLEHHKKIEELHLKKDAAQKKFNELKEASDESWEDLKAGVELSWNVLGEAVKSGISRFK